MTHEQACGVGELLGAAGHDDMVDGVAVEGAARRGDLILTADRTHIERLAAASSRTLAIETF